MFFYARISPESSLRNFFKLLKQKEKKKKKKNLSIPPPIRAREMAACRPMREDAGKRRQRRFKFEQNSLTVMLFGMKKIVKTKRVSNKTSRKINKTNVKT